jgi:hypothetical protein
VHYFRTTRPNQDFLRAPIYEGENEIASINDYLGMVEGELPGDLPVGTDVEMHFHVDQDGVVFVKVTVPSHPGVELSAKVMTGSRGVEVIDPQPPPGRWKREARDAVARADGTLLHGEKYIPPDAVARIRRLQSELELALDSNDQAAGTAKTNELKEELERLGGINALILAEAMATSPRIDPVDQADLRRLLQAVIRGTPNAASALVNKIEEILGKLPPPPPGEPDGGDLDPWVNLLEGRR